MDELIRGAATHRDGMVDWLFTTDGTEALALDGAQGIYDAIDQFVMDHPGHRVIIAIERDKGSGITPTDLRLLRGD